MKVRTLDGKGLRSAGYTEFECHALIHAAGHCAAGETFQGVPTSANVVYQKSDDTFFVASKDDDTVTVIRHSNGKTLTARIIQDGETKKETKTKTTEKTETKEMETTTTNAKMEQLQQAAALLELLKSNGGYCCAGDKYNAEAVETVLSKNCKTYLDAQQAGTIKPLSTLDSLLMRVVYKLKYSKQAEE